MLGYLNTPVFASHHIPVGSGHTLYVEEAGKPQGCPVVFLSSQDVTCPARQEATAHGFKGLAPHQNSMAECHLLKKLEVIGQVPRQLILITNPARLVLGIYKSQHGVFLPFYVRMF